VVVEEQVGNSSFAAFFNRTWQQTTATARAHNPEVLGVENISMPQARFHEGYREIPHDSRKTSKMSNAKLFNDVQALGRRNVDFSLFDKFNSLSYVESDDSKRFSRKLRTYLPFRSSCYNV